MGMTPVRYGNPETFIYFLVSSEGKLSIADTTIEWAAVGRGEPVEVWFEPDGATGDEVHTGDSVYIVAKGRVGLTRYLVKRPIGESLKWSSVRSEPFHINVAGLPGGQPIPIGATVLFGDAGEHIGLGDNDFLELKGEALPFEIAVTS